MKRLFLLLTVTALCLAALPQTSQAQYYGGGQWLGVDLTLLAGPLGIGVSYENGFDKEFGITADVRYFSWEQNTSNGISVDRSIIYPQVGASYHFQPQNQIDPFAGAQIGFMIYSSDASDLPAGENFKDQRSSSFTISLNGGTRYFFTPKIAGKAMLEFIFGADDYQGDFDEAVFFSLGAEFSL